MTCPTTLDTETEHGTRHRADTWICCPGIFLVLFLCILGRVLLVDHHLVHDLLVVHLDHDLLVDLLAAVRGLVILHLCLG